MKKIIYSLPSVLALAFTAPQAFAATTVNACPGNGFSALCFSDPGALGRVIGSLITFGFALIGLVALAFLVWGGIKWLTSQGEKAEVEGARNHIINAVIGLIVIFLSYLVVNLLLTFITGGKVTLSNITIPTLGQP